MMRTRCGGRRQVLAAELDPPQLAPPIDLRPGGQEPLDLPGHRDEQARAPLVARPSPLPRGRQRVAIHLAPARGGIHARHQAVGTEVKVEGYGGRPRLYRRARGRIIDRAPRHALARHERGRVPRRLGEPAHERAGGDIGCVVHVRQRQDAGDRGTHPARAVHERIAHAHVESRRHADARVPHESRRRDRGGVAARNGCQPEGGDSRNVPVCSRRAWRTSGKPCGITFVRYRWTGAGKSASSLASNRAAPSGRDSFSSRATNASVPALHRHDATPASSTSPASTATSSITKLFMTPPATSHR